MRPATTFLITLLSLHTVNGHCFQNIEMNADLAYSPVGELNFEGVPESAHKGPPLSERLRPVKINIRARKVEMSNIKLRDADLVVDQLILNNLTSDDSTVVIREGVEVTPHSTVDSRDSQFSFQKYSMLSTGAELKFHDSRVEFSDTVMFEPLVHMFLTGNSVLLVDGRLTLSLDKQSIQNGAAIRLEKGASAAFNTDLEVRIKPDAYFPRDYHYHVVDDIHTDHQSEGEMRLVRSPTLTRILVLDNHWVLSRTVNPTAYSDAASDEESSEVALVLDSLIPIAEADPKGPDAKTLAYFDSIDDPEMYNQAVLRYRDSGGAGIAYQGN